VPLIPSCVWPRATAIRPARVAFLTPALCDCREPDLGRSSSASAWPPQMSLKHQSWSPEPRIQDAGGSHLQPNAICLRLRGLTRPATSGRMASERSEGRSLGEILYHGDCRGAPSALPRCGGICLAPSDCRAGRRSSENGNAASKTISGV
jgi:hypothetical protein